jgi:hypothetical protein
MINIPSTPSSVSRTKRPRASFLTTTTTKPALASTPTVKSSRTPKRKSSQLDTNSDPIDPEDSDSDSLAGIEETPSKRAKKQRLLPTRTSRTPIKTYAVVKGRFGDDDDADADNTNVRPDDGTVEDTEDEYNPFQLRREQAKKDARSHRTRRQPYDWLSS